MSFITYKRIISLGDRVIVYLGYDEIHSILITKDLVHQTKYGAIKHNDLVGKPFGCKLQILNGFVHLLFPTPELWTSALRHRTQILYNIDISEILFKLDIRPGSVVVEAGTGSGSLSHSILRTIYPSGYLHTFDFHSGRVEEAQLEFKEHGFDSKIVSIKQKDVCAEGFGLSSGCIDAVFLDLPSPWLAVPHAAYCLTEGGRICCFSPCIEQVQRTYKALRQNTFSDMITIECLNRELIVRETFLTIPDLGFNNRNKNIDDRNIIKTGDSKLNNSLDKTIFNEKNIHIAIDNSNNIDDDGLNQINVLNVTSSNIKDTEINKLNDSLIDKSIYCDHNNKDYTDMDTNKNIELIKDSASDQSTNFLSDNLQKTVKLIKVNEKFYCNDCINSMDFNSNKNVEKAQTVFSCQNNEDIESEIDFETVVKKIKLDANCAKKDTNKRGNKCQGEMSFVSLSSGLKITGHTGYLTFATLYPS